MTVNPKTRPPSMCPGKKLLGHPLEEPRCHHKHLLRSSLLKNSPCTEPVCSRVYYLQKRRVFVLKNDSISAEPNRPTQDCRAQKYQWLIFFKNSIELAPKHNRHIMRFWYAPGCIDRSPYHSRESAVKKQMLYRFIFMTETTLLVPLPIPFCKIIFCKNNASSMCGDCSASIWIVMFDSCLSVSVCFISTADLWCTHIGNSLRVFCIC